MTLYALHHDWIDGHVAQAPVGIWNEDGESYYPPFTVHLQHRGYRAGSRPPERSWAGHLEYLTDSSSAYNANWSIVDSELTMPEILITLQERFFAVEHPEPTLSGRADGLPGHKQDSEGREEDSDLPKEDSVGRKEDSGEDEGKTSAFTPAHRYVIAQSWWVASELARRHPDLVIHEMHPGGGMYDCLALLSPGDLKPFVQLNRVGTIHVMSTPEYRTTWAEALEAASPHAVVKEIEQVADLKMPAKAPASTPRTLAYRFIAATLNATLNDRYRWDARNEFFDSSEDNPTVLNGYLAGFPEVRRSLPATPQMGLWHEPESHYWALLRNDSPVAIVSIEGVVYRPDRQIDLTTEYRRHDSRMQPVVASALADVLP
ncbi:MAG: hypothetical protein C0444_09700 [Microbacterium sp.]|nr:hypothetical protein [Microbacterium sp.]MBA4345071.1 hypothetical protein [Microbacterium sp.]